MAERRGGGRKASTPAKSERKDVPTEYVVFYGLDLVGHLKDDAIPDYVPGDGGTALMAWLPILNAKAEHGPDGEVRVVKAKTQDEAISIVAGKPPKPGQPPPAKPPLPGRWKAVALSSWKGGRRHQEPQQVTIFPSEAIE